MDEFIKFEPYEFDEDELEAAAENQVVSSKSIRLIDDGIQTNEVFSTARFQSVVTTCPVE